MLTVNEFKVGDSYSNDQVRFSLNLENLGGIRPSVDKGGNLKHLALLTTLPTARKRKQENPYEDRIEDDVLVYTASGKEGDQELTGKNRRLLEQYQNPLPFFGFANEGRQLYRFIGLLELIRHYPEKQLDKTGVLRMVWVFEFAIHREPAVIPIEGATQIAAKLITEARRRLPLVAEDKTVILEVGEPFVRLPDQKVFVELEQVRATLLTVDPSRFEHLLKDLIESRGFQGVKVTSYVADGGIDLFGYVPESDDFFAGTLTQFQAKRWRHSVGSVEVNGFRGALSVSAKGVFVTTSHFTKAAIAEARHAEKPSITLVDGAKLSMMILTSKLDLNHYLI
jgi:hypothetical protein